MNQLKHCPFCSAVCNEDELHWEYHQIRCAYCCNMEEGEPGCIELSEEEWEALKECEEDFGYWNQVGF